MDSSECHYLLLSFAGDFSNVSFALTLCLSLRRAFFEGSHDFNLAGVAVARESALMTLHAILSYRVVARCGAKNKRECEKFRSGKRAAQQESQTE